MALDNTCPTEEFIDGVEFDNEPVVVDWEKETDDIE